MKNKSDLRLLAKSIRKNLDISSISEQIVSNIRIKYNNCNLLYGIKIDKNQKIKYKLKAIFTFNDK